MNRAGVLFFASVFWGLVPLTFALGAAYMLHETGGWALPLIAGIAWILRVAGYWDMLPTSLGEAREALRRQ